MSGLIEWSVDERASHQYVAAVRRAFSRVDKRLRLLAAPSVESIRLVQRDSSHHAARYDPLQKRVVVAEWFKVNERTSSYYRRNSFLRLLNHEYGHAVDFLVASRLHPHGYSSHRSFAKAIKKDIAAMGGGRNHFKQGYRFDYCERPGEIFADALVAHFGDGYYDRDTMQGYFPRAFEWIGKHVLAL